jgi:hypothetical protein
MTVNGIFAVVYWCEFIVKHVSSEEEKNFTTVLTKTGRHHTCRTLYIACRMMV